MRLCAIELENFKGIIFLIPWLCPGMQCVWLRQTSSRMLAPFSGTVGSGQTVFRVAVQHNQGYEAEPRNK